MQEEKLISDRDILELSLRIEREGLEFYRALAERVDNPLVRKFIQQMAREEAQHEKLFIKMLEQKGDQLYGWEHRKEVKEFIESQLKANIFPPVDELEDTGISLDNLQKAVDFAIEAEEVSAEFYCLLGEYCDDLETKTALALLEKAEREHVQQVLALRDKLVT